MSPSSKSVTMPDNNYSPVPERPTEFLNGLTIEYKGFTISDTFLMYKDGKHVKFPRCWTLDACKRMIDASIACKGRQTDMGKALISLGICQTDAERFQEQYMQHEENKMWEDSK